MAITLPEHISYSALKTWKRCPHLFKLQYIDKIRHIQEHGVHLDFGKALHRTIELTRPKTGKKPITYPIKHFKRVFKLLYHKNYKFYSTKDQREHYNPNFLISIGELIILDFLANKFLQEVEVLANELLLNEEIQREDGLKIRFKGFIDLVILAKERNKKVIYICDFKTTKWGWSIIDRRNLELTAQLYYYKHFLCKKFNLDPDEVRTAFILFKKNKKTNHGEKLTERMEFVKVSSGPSAVQRALDELNRSLTKIKKMSEVEHFPKNRQMCIDPKFKSICPFLYDRNYCSWEDNPGRKVVIAAEEKYISYDCLSAGIQKSTFLINEIVCFRDENSHHMEKWAKDHQIKFTDFPVKENPTEEDIKLCISQMIEYSDGLLIIANKTKFMERKLKLMVQEANKRGIKYFPYLVNSLYMKNNILENEQVDNEKETHSISG